MAETGALPARRVARALPSSPGPRTEDPFDRVETRVACAIVAGPSTSPATVLKMIKYLSLLLTVPGMVSPVRLCQLLGLNFYETL
ncbi:MAG: hypothetical protein R6V44_08900, partial [Paracoccaceae bacterium]